MNEYYHNLARIEQTHRELNIFQDEVTNDLRKRQHLDKQSRYSSQLASLQTVLSDSITSVQRALSRLDAHAAASTVYPACRELDQSTLLLRRVLAYYQHKFDQRNNSRLQATLLAADDIAWSCYAGVFQQSKGALRPPQPMPLPYIEAEYSPKAIPRSEPTADVRPSRADPLLWAYLKELPIPVISLPPVCAEHPCWLIYIGHEIGHHVQYDLLPKAGLVAQFKQLIRETVQRQCNIDVYDTAQRWALWGEEIFADIASVFYMGPWAVRALLELTRDNERAMLSYADERYPCAVIRLQLLKVVLERLGLPNHSALQPINPYAIVQNARVAESDPVREQLKVDFSLIGPVVECALTEYFEPIGKLEHMYDWRASDFAPDGVVSLWTEALRRRYAAATTPARRTAREIMGGVLGARAEIIAIDNMRRRQREYKQFNKQLFSYIERNREPVERAGESSTASDVRGLGEKLTQQLLHALHERSSATQPGVD